MAAVTLINNKSVNQVFSIGINLISKPHTKGTTAYPAPEADKGKNASHWH